MDNGVTFHSILRRALEGIRGQMQGFHLAGGTALSMFYLHHRLSFDIDLFCGKGAFEGSMSIRKIWEEEGIRVVPEIETENPRMFRARLLGGAGEAKADFVEDPVRLLSPPEDMDGIRVMGIDDIYLRKVLIGAGQGVTGKFHRAVARDILDLYSLHMRHASLSKRLLDAGIETRAMRGMHGWIRRFQVAEVSAAIRDTAYQESAPPVEILRVLQEEVETAIGARLDEITRNAT